MQLARGQHTARGLRRTVAAGLCSGGAVPAPGYYPGRAAPCARCGKPPAGQPLDTCHQRPPQPASAVSPPAHPHRQASAPPCGRGVRLCARPGAGSRTARASPSPSPPVVPAECGTEVRSRSTFPAEVRSGCGTSPHTEPSTDLRDGTDETGFAHLMNRQAPTRGNRAKTTTMGLTSTCAVLSVRAAGVLGYMESEVLQARQDAHIPRGRPARVPMFGAGRRW